MLGNNSGQMFLSASQWTRRSYDHDSESGGKYSGAQWLFGVMKTTLTTLSCWNTCKCKNLGFSLKNLFFLF